MAKESSKKEKRHWGYERSHVINGLLFCTPWILGFLILTAFPIFQTLRYSFHRVVITTEGIELTWLGFANYRELFSSTAFTNAIEAYFFEILLGVPIVIVFSLILAMVLNSTTKFKGILRSVFFLPVVITSGPVFAVFIEQGVAEFPGIEQFLDFETLAQTMPLFAVNALEMLITQFIMLLWFSGIQMLIFLTALQKIDTGMFEAASIDGASKWAVFWKLVLPSLLPVIIINVIFTVVIMSTFPLNPIIQMIQYDMVDRGLGYASAISWLYTLTEIFMLGLFLGFIMLILGRKKKIKVKTYY